MKEKRMNTTDRAAPLTDEEAARAAGGSSGRYIRIDTARCVGCANCADVCPTSVISVL